MIVSATTVALGVIGVGLVCVCGSLKRRLRAAQVQVRAERRQINQVTGQLRAAETFLGTVATEVIPDLRSAVLLHGQRHYREFPMPGELAGTPLAQQLSTCLHGLTAALRHVQGEVREAAEVDMSAARAAATARADEAHRRAQDATRAAVLSVTQSLVVTASRVSRLISEAVREHQNDAAYATLIAIDQRVQQILLAADSYAVLSGGKLTRRSPASTLTDIVRASMNALDGFERIHADQSDAVLTARATGPAVLTLAVLLNNALQYSTPNSYVEVRIQHGARGVTVTVDDAGLQISPEELERARRLFSGTEHLDINSLGAKPRTGFAVAATLAHAYGFTVGVEAPSPFHGTRAQVFFPKELLTTPSPADEVRPHLSATTPPATTGNGPVTTTNGLAIRRRAAAPIPAGTPTRPPATAASATVSASLLAAWTEGKNRARSTPNPTSHEGK